MVFICLPCMKLYWFSFNIFQIISGILSVKGRANPRERMRGLSVVVGLLSAVAVLAGDLELELGNVSSTTYSAYIASCLFLLLVSYLWDAVVCEI